MIETLAKLAQKLEDVGRDDLAAAVDELISLAAEELDWTGGPRVDLSRIGKLIAEQIGVFGKGFDHIDIFKEFSDYVKFGPSKGVWPTAEEAERFYDGFAQEAKLEEPERKMGFLERFEKEAK